MQYDSQPPHDSVSSVAPAHSVIPPTYTTHQHMAPNSRVYSHVPQINHNVYIPASSVPTNAATAASQDFHGYAYPPTQPQGQHRRGHGHPDRVVSKTFRIPHTQSSPKSIDELKREIAGKVSSELDVSPSRVVISAAPDQNGQTPTFLSGGSAIQCTVLPAETGSQGMPASHICEYIGRSLRPTTSLPLAQPCVQNTATTQATTVNTMPATRSAHGHADRVVTKTFHVPQSQRSPISIDTLKGDITARLSSELGVSPSRVVISAVPDDGGQVPTFLTGGSRIQCTVLPANIGSQEVPASHVCEYIGRSLGTPATHSAQPILKNRLATNGTMMGAVSLAQSVSSLSVSLPSDIPYRKDSGSLSDSEVLPHRKKKSHRKEPPCDPLQEYSTVPHVQHSSYYPRASRSLPRSSSQQRRIRRNHPYAQFLEHEDSDREFYEVPRHRGRQRRRSSSLPPPRRYRQIRGKAPN